MNPYREPIDFAAVLSADHGELHDALARAAREPAPIGPAAQRVVKYFAEHAEKESRTIAPLLALLPDASHGKIDARMADAIPVFRELESVLPDMVAEHHVIRAALESLVAAGREKERPDIAEIAGHALAHMRMEEAVVYPAALLLGRYLRIRFGTG
jgi:hypothetical protein